MSERPVRNFKEPVYLAPLYVERLRKLSDEAKRTIGAQAELLLDLGFRAAGLDPVTAPELTEAAN